MENRAAFTSFWERNCPDSTLPDLDFFESAEELQDRVDLCKQNLKEALRILEHEGLIFRFLSRIVNSNDYDDFKGEVCGVLRRVFSDTLGFSSDGSDIETSTQELEPTHCQELNPNPETEDEPFLVRGSSFAFTIDPKQEQQKRTLLTGVNASESGHFAHGGSEDRAVDEQQLHLAGVEFPSSTTQPSAGRDVELLNNQNDKVFLSGPNLPYDIEEKLSSNEDGAVNNTSNQTDLITARDSCQMDSTKVKNAGLNTKGDNKDHENITANSLRGSLKSASLPLNTERSCKWQSEQATRPYSCGNYQIPDTSTPFETKTNETHTKQVLESCDINLKAGESIDSQTEDIMSRHDSSMQAKQDDDDRHSNSSEERPTLAEEETFLVELSESKEDLDQETIVVDDLISYLEGIELENSSEEEDFAVTEGSGRISYGFPRKNGGMSRKKQLQSALSTASAISTDSCLSPYALDVAMSEIHSGESSDQDETSSLGEGSAPNQGDSLTKPPAKPPRRRSKKGMVRAHTVGTPIEVKTKSRGYSEEDEVFSKEEEGYEGICDNIIKSKIIPLLYLLE